MQFTLPEQKERYVCVHVYVFLFLDAILTQGSVCAMCERILRTHRLKTGFYSLVLCSQTCKPLTLDPSHIKKHTHIRSPHLLEVRERIRLDGRPLTKSQFVSYFWECYNKLDSTKVYVCVSTLIFKLFAK